MAARSARRTRKASRSKPKSKTHHVRVVCPHCRHTVKLNPPTGFQPAVRCPNCRRPISTQYIAAAQARKASPPAQTTEESPATQATEESAPATSEEAVAEEQESEG